MIRRTLIFFAAAAVIASPTRASDSGEQPDPARALKSLATVRMASAEESRRFETSAGWRDFTTRHPGWRAQWNAVTETPHRAVGRPIPLPAFVPDAAGVDRAVRAFIAGHPGTFGAPGLETVSVRDVRGTWYVRYRQMAGGLPVLHASWEFRVSRQGRLFAFGAPVQNVSAKVLAAVDRVGAVGAIAAATRDLPPLAGGDRVNDGGLAILPWEGAHRLVRVVTVQTEEPPGDWLTIVDAASGETLVRTNREFNAISGSSSGTVHPLFSTDTPESRPMRDLRVFFGLDSRVTDSTGVYAIPGTSGTDSVISTLSGPYCRLLNLAGPSPRFGTVATDPAVVNVTWDDANSDLAARDAFYNINRARDHIRIFDPLFTGLDYSLTARVNGTGTCNAGYTNQTITFYRAGAGCPNMAYLADVAWHEYGHALNQALYLQQGAPFGLENTACHEGTADVFSAFLTDDPIIGQGFFGFGTILRNIDNTMRWPDDDNPDSHVAGLILAGAYWDLREAVGLDVARTLSHYAKYGLPDAPGQNGVAMNDFFFETLVADDTDGDLTNGTPHFAQIVDAFNKHGIGSGYWLVIGHTNVPDGTGAPPYAIRGTFTYNGTFGALDIGASRLHYQVNGGAWTSRMLTPTDNTNEYMGLIDAPPQAVVRYYFEAVDTFGGRNVVPAEAPYNDTFEFIIGEPLTVLFQNMETAPGWTVGAPGDNALTGIWVRVNPNSTYMNGYVQPEDDHTPLTGLRCWVTGDAGIAEPPSLNDVDAGHTTLNTMVFDATSAGYAPMVEYYRWFSNFFTGEHSDPWRVQISNDAGLTWTDVENTVQDAREWRRILFLIQEYVEPTSTMKMRFIATDENEGSLIEAAVDDFRLLAFPAPLDVPDVVGAPFALAPPAPNPLRFGMRARIGFTLPREGSARLAVLDVQGREVAVLADGALPAGAQSVEWDGRAVRGGRVAPGMYFLSLTSGSERRTHRMVVLE